MAFPYVAAEDAATHLVRHSCISSRFMKPPGRSVSSAAECVCVFSLNYVQAGEQSLIPRGIREALLHARLQRVCCSSEPVMPTVPLPQVARRAPC